MIRLGSKHGFAQVANEVLNDKRLSYKAKGIYAVIMSFPPGWQIQEKFMIDQSREGRDSYLTGLRELKKVGLYVRVMFLHKGRAQWETIVFDSYRDSKEWLEEYKKQIEIKKGYYYLKFNPIKIEYVENQFESMGKPDIEKQVGRNSGELKIQDLNNTYKDFNNTYNESNNTKKNDFSKNEKSVHSSKNVSHETKSMKNIINGHSNKYCSEFESRWKLLPNKHGKPEAGRKWNSVIKHDGVLERLDKAIKNFNIEMKGREPKYIMMGKTFFNNWQDYETIKKSKLSGLEYVEEQIKEMEKNGK